MAKKSKRAEKKPTSAATEIGECGNVDTSSTVNSTTEALVNQEETEFRDEEKGRHFWYVVYPSEAYFKTHYPDGTYNGSEGWGEAPDDWVQQLEATGLAFQVSEMHYRDVNPDDKEKKPHWHVIVSWGNSTTYRSARALCELLKCPRPKILRNVTGAYRYHRHLDNPEKYQYATFGTYHNGWEPPLDSNEVTRIKRELKDMVLIEDIQEYVELLIVCESRGQAYLDVAVNNTIFCERICASYRHNPLRVLMRYFNECKDEDVKKLISARIDELTGGKNYEGNDSECTHQRA